MKNRVVFPIIAAAALMLFARGGRTQEALPHPVAEWKFEEGIGTSASDASGQAANSLMLRGGADWTTGGVGTHALRFGGRAGSFAEIARPVVDTSRSFTVTACVKVNRIGGYQTFVSVDGQQISGFFLQLRDDTGEFALTLPPVDGTNGDAAVAASDIAPMPNVWYHLTGVYDANAHTAALYVNGALQQKVPVQSTWKATGSTVIGRGKFGGNPVDWVNGAVDEVRLYDAPLSAADARSLARMDLPNAMQQSEANSGPATLKINAAQPGPRVSPMLYGLMTEEINYSYDGGLYGELIRNRVFKDDPANPVHWSVITSGSMGNRLQEGGAGGEITLDTAQPLTPALPTSLKLRATGAAEKQRVGVANDGYWGIPVKPHTRYRASFYARADQDFTGPITASIENANGTEMYARAQTGKITPEWKQYTLTLTTGNVAPTKDTRFVLATNKPGTVWFNLVSLFPPTYKNRPNGNRPDLMQRLADMKPSFLRLPGGNYLEGDTIATRFDWKKTLGPLTQRPGHMGTWSYRSSDGMGLQEFLQWCEDLKIEPLLGVYAGYSLRGEHVTPGPDLQPYVQDALDEIEYVTGDAAATKWGAIRAKNGHPAPFPLHYIEIGNEDNFDRSGSYDGRFAQFYDAIKAAYPKLQLIATTSVRSRKPDILDDHFYRTARAMERDAHHYDRYDRNGPKIFVGEWASQDIDQPWARPETKGPTPTLNSALGDAAWMTGMERNSDLVILSAYAPLLVNVNPGGRQWAVNLIGYDALTNYGSPSYYAQAMFAANHGDTILPATLTGTARLTYSVTRDSKSGMVYVKMVNTSAQSQAARITLDGVTSVAATGTAIVLKGSGPQDTNTITEPTKIVPVTTSASGLGTDFTYTFAPYSVTILKMQAR